MHSHETYLAALSVFDLTLFGTRLLTILRLLALLSSPPLRLVSLAIERLKRDLKERLNTHIYI